MGVGVSVSGYSVPHDGCSVIDISNPPVATPGHKTMSRKKLKQPSFLTFVEITVLFSSFLFAA
jgi:hypothetical protein